MTESGKPIRSPKPQMPNPMISVEPAFKEAISHVVSRWAKRLKRRGHSS